MAELEKTGEVAALLRRVAFLAELEEAGYEAVWRAGRIRHARDGEVLVSELETGEDLFLILDGRVEVTVGTGSSGEPVHLAWLETGAALGEVAAFTGELRTATATARGAVTTLVVDHEEFLDLCHRYPRMAAGMAKVLADRQAHQDRLIASLLQSRAPDAPGSLPPIVASRPVKRGLLRRAWVELVQARKRDLTFLLLTSFVLALAAARLGVWLAHHAGVRLLPLLRVLYVGGLGLTVVASLLAVLYFRPSLRRVICVAFGAGLALAFNELSVFIAFDVFFLDMTTRDPKLAFDVARLYHRTESLYAVAIVLGLALQATYLRRFYRRLAFDVGVKINGLLRRLGR
jgi:CRP/FNR family transcriptional regulator, cyclic AMP receptor protein